MANPITECDRVRSYAASDPPYLHPFVDRKRSISGVRGHSHACCVWPHCRRAASRASPAWRPAGTVLRVIEIPPANLEHAAKALREAGLCVTVQEAEPLLSESKFSAIMAWLIRLGRSKTLNMG